MRILCLTAVAVLGIMIVPAAEAAAQSPLRIAYVDSRLLLSEAPGSDQAQQMFEQEMSGFQQEVQQLGDSLQSAMTSFQQQARDMPAERRDSIAQTIELQQIAYQQRVAVLEQQAAQREMQLAQPIMQNIQRVLNDVRSEEGYHFIFDVAAQGSPVVAADTTLDITQAVLARLKALPAPALPPAASAPAATTPPAGPVAQPAGVRRPPGRNR